VVFACTDSREVNRLVGVEARRRNVPVVVADRQSESTFFTPATMRDGDLAIAISTGGASPGLARLIRERVAAAGLGDRVEVVLRDYRELEGRYPKIVSIEMLEAVGEDYWPAFFAACDRLLAPGGAVALQTITMPHRRYLASRHAYTWIHKYIFPGGLIPSREAIDRTLGEATTLRVTHAAEIGRHYATTLRHWRTRFLAERERVHALGFDGAFVRMWEFYLAYCEAGFATEAIGDVQLRLART